MKNRDVLGDHIFFGLAGRFLLNQKSTSHQSCDRHTARRNNSGRAKAQPQNS